MGGRGSGRWRDHWEKPTIRDLDRLDADAAAGRIGGAPEPGRFAVTVRGVGPLILEAACQPCGGLRWWWRCPGCDVRRLTLYRRGGRWACRVCLGLAYPSQRARHRIGAGEWRRRYLRQAPRTKAT
jgi:hypothetical protein